MDLLVLHTHMVLLDLPALTAHMVLLVPTVHQHLMASTDLLVLNTHMVLLDLPALTAQMVLLVPTVLQHPMASTDPLDPLALTDLPALLAPMDHPLLMESAALTVPSRLLVPLTVHTEQDIQETLTLERRTMESLTGEKHDFWLLMKALYALIFHKKD